MKSKDSKEKVVVARGFEQDVKGTWLATQRKRALTVMSSADEEDEAGAGVDDFGGGLGGGTLLLTGGAWVGFAGPGAGAVPDGEPFWM